MRKLDDINSGQDTRNLRAEDNVISIKESEKFMVEKKKKEMIEKFGELIEFVDNRYENSNIAKNEEQLGEFKKHNRQILELVIEEGTKRGISDEEMEILVVSAILHDLCKGDLAPEWAKGIDNFMVVYHGEAVAQEIENSEELQAIIREKLGDENFDENIKKLQTAFRSHMGPGVNADSLGKDENEIEDSKIGFMAKMRRGINAKLRERGIEEMKHPLPEKGDDISEILLAADMFSLASPSGAQKVLKIRSLVPNFKKEDQNLCSDYKKEGIELSLGEAALISAFNSGNSARDMFEDKNDQKWIQKAIDQTESFKGFKYGVDDENMELVNAQIVKEKMIAFEEAKKQREFRERIDEAA